MGGSEFNIAALPAQPTYQCLGVYETRYVFSVEPGAFDYIILH